MYSRCLNSKKKKERLILKVKKVFIRDIKIHFKEPNSLKVLKKHKIISTLFDGSY